MSSLSFDPVAHLYDSTRGFPEEVIRQVVESIGLTVNGNSQARFFEVGVGTGRFAFPLVTSGYQYTGIDISEKMLSQLLKKLLAAGWQEEVLPWGNMPDEDLAQNPPVQRLVHKENQGAIRLAIADMTAIPFSDASFDVVMAIHVFHLVSNWQKALQEAMRVLRPGGVLIRCWEENWQEYWKPGSHDIKNHWCTIVQELGGSTEHPGTSDQVVTEWLQKQGFETEQIAILRWQRRTTSRSIFEGIAQRAWTSTQVVPDTIFAASLERLQEWLEERYGEDIDKVFTQEERVIISKTQL